MLLRDEHRGHARSNIREGLPGQLRRDGRRRLDLRARGGCVRLQRKVSGALEHGSAAEAGNALKLLQISVWLGRMNAKDAKSATGALTGRSAELGVELAVVGHPRR